jgi:hypothetical protein
MFKAINYIYTNIRALLVICIIVCLVLFGIYKFNQSYKIHYTYHGIKFQSYDLNYAKSLNIEINGIYKKGYFSQSDLFDGQIIIDGDMCYGILGDGTRSNKYAFNKEKVSIIESDNFKGSIFIGDMMREITIEINEPNITGGASFSYMNGWIISAPCENREQAVYISNKLVQNIYKDVLIK